MRIFKGISIIALMLGLGFAAFGQNADDFQIQLEGSGASQTVTITKYKGTAVWVTIPDRIDNLNPAICSEIRKRFGDNPFKKYE